MVDKFGFFYSSASNQYGNLSSQVIGNCLAHALAYAAVNLDLSQPDVCEWFLQYCGQVEAQNNIGVRLDS
jgi:hypothetical protein